MHSTDVFIVITMCCFVTLFQDGAMQKKERLHSNKFGAVFPFLQNLQAMNTLLS